MTFKLNGKKFLITYPQCPLSKDTLLAGLQAIRELDKYVVCNEPHADGQPHAHACVHFKDKVHTTSSRFFDIEGYHPNVKPLKTAGDFRRAEEYCKKGGDYLTNIEDRLTSRQQLAKELLENGKIDREFIVAHPDVIFLNFSSISSWLEVCRPQTTTVKYPDVKRRHYWLTGPSNSGKTYQLRRYISGKKAVEIPDNNDYRCDEETEVLWADEFKGHLTVQQLNRPCDGHTQLNKKGGSTRILFPVVFICSNYSIRDCYQKVSDEIYETLLNRFNEYCLPNSIIDF